MQLFVSPAGNDLNAGSAEAPLRTMPAARDRLRGLPPGTAAEVVLLPGDYPLEQGLKLEAIDSGTTAAPRVWRAGEGGAVRLLGGRLLKGFRPVEEPGVLARLAPAARGHVLAVDASGLGELGGLSSRGFNRPSGVAHSELFYDGRRMTVARWPNDEFALIAGPGDAGDHEDGHGGKLGRLEAGFHYDGDRPRGWAPTEDLWVHGYWAWNWANSYERVAALDVERRLIVTAPPHGHYGFRPGQRFYFLNILEELDAPGEYHVDRQRGMVYFWPPDDRQAEAALSLLGEPLLALDGVSHVRIEGLTLQYGRERGICVTGGEGVIVRGCTLRNLGTDAIRMEGGHGHQVADCTLASLGDGGISLLGGDRRTLQPGAHAAVGNRIHDFTEWSRTYKPGIFLAGVGHRVIGNELHHAPHSAILMNGNDHLIERNLVHHVCLEAGDAGAFYLGRDYTERGVVVQNNYFHDVGGYKGDASAVYLDDCASGVTVRGNVIQACSRAVLLGGGVDNLIEGNVFIDCPCGIHVDGRGVSEAAAWRDMVYGTLRQRFFAMDPLQPPYSERYPELAKLIPWYEPGQTGGIPAFGNRIRRNLARGGEWLRVSWCADATWLELEGNLAEERPGTQPGRCPAGQWTGTTTSGCGGETRG